MLCAALVLVASAPLPGGVGPSSASLQSDTVPGELLHVPRSEGTWEFLRMVGFLQYYSCTRQYNVLSICTM